MESNISAQHAREARYAKAKETEDKMKKLQSVGREAELEAYLADQGRFHKRESADKTMNKFLKDSNSVNRSPQAGTAVPQYVRRPMTRNPATQRGVRRRANEFAQEAQHVEVESKHSECDSATKQLHATTPDVDQPTSNNSTDHTHNSAVRGDFPKLELSSIDADVPPSPLNDDKLPASPLYTILERPANPHTLFASVPLPFSSIEHPTQLPALRPNEIPAFTGRSTSSTPSDEPRRWTAFEDDGLTESQKIRRAKAMLVMRNLKAGDSLSSNVRRSARVQHESGRLQEKQVKPAQVGFDGTDDSDSLFEQNEPETASSPAPAAAGTRSTRSSALRSASNASVVSALAVPSSENESIARDTSFSTRPSRVAARNASAAISASRPNRGRGKGKGRARPRVTASAPPPPPPPPPPPRSPGHASGHNKTWGFTTGPDGPWIEPPVINDPMFTRPSQRRNLKKDVKEAIAQLEKEDPKYDPHAPNMVRKQEDMYGMRVWGATGQWPTSNLRGAVDWEENQKRRMGVAVRAAMKEAEEEERAEREEEERKAKMKETAGKERGNGEGSSRSDGQAMDSDSDSDEDESATARSDCDTDYAEAKSDNDEDATVVGEQSQSDDDDDAASLPSAHLNTIPLSLNKGFTRRIAAERKTRLVSRRTSNTVPKSDAMKQPQASVASSNDVTPNADQDEDDNDRQLDGVLSYHEGFFLRRAAMWDAHRRRMVRHLDNEPTEAQAPPPFSFRTFSRSDHNPQSPGASPCMTGNRDPLHIPDYEHRNIQAFGQIGGAADMREARPAHGPYVFGDGEAPPSQEQYNARTMDLMERHLGLQLEDPPQAGEAFPALTGERPQFLPVRGGAGPGAVSGQQRQPPRPQ